jgi:hypothetical protein
MLIVLFYSWCHKFFYEIFLRVHQILAAFFFFCLWKHISFTSFYSRLYLYLMLEIFSLSFVLHVMIFLYHNEILRHNLLRAIFIRNKEIVKLNMSLFRSLKVRVEQYINLWIASVDFWSFLQSHSFMMISWFENKQRTLKLLIESRKDLTRELFHHSKLDEIKITSRLTLFSDSHDVSISVERYESVLMIAVDHDIIAQLFYVRRLINKYNTDEVRICRMHLAWQLDSFDKYKVKHTSIELIDSDIDLTIESLLQEILKKDARNLINRLVTVVKLSNFFRFWIFQSI